MNVIFQIEGGLGKSIMATAMVKVIKKVANVVGDVLMAAWCLFFLACVIKAVTM